MHFPARTVNFIVTPHQPVKLTSFQRSPLAGKGRIGQGERQKTCGVVTTQNKPRVRTSAFAPFTKSADNAGEEERVSRPTNICKNQLRHLTHERTRSQTRGAGNFQLTLLSAAMRAITEQTWYSLAFATSVERTYADGEMEEERGRREKQGRWVGETHRMLDE